MVSIKSYALKTIKEEFNEYLLEDGNVLKAKQVMISFSLTDEITKDELGRFVKTLTSFQLVTGIVPIGQINTKDFPLSKSDIIPKEDFVKEVKFEEKKAHINIYETDDFFVFLRTDVRKVWLTKYKDEAGTPRYHIEANAVMIPQQKKLLFKTKTSSVNPENS